MSENAFCKATLHYTYASLQCSSVTLQEALSSPTGLDELPSLRKAALFTSVLWNAQWVSPLAKDLRSCFEMFLSLPLSFDDFITCKKLEWSFRNCLLTLIFKKVWPAIFGKTLLVESSSIPDCLLSISFLLFSKFSYKWSGGRESRRTYIWAVLVLERNVEEKLRFLKFQIRFFKKSFWCMSFRWIDEEKLDTATLIQQLCHSHSIFYKCFHISLILVAVSYKFSGSVLC